MELLDVELSNEPLDIEPFSYLSDTDYPVVMLGFQLKNLYDQKRLIFKSKFKTNEIIHFVPRETMMPKFFRGIKLNIKTSIIPFIKMLDNLGNSPSSEINLTTYKEILKKYNLTCDNCYAFLHKGIYPIDSECTGVISNISLTVEDIFSLIDKSLCPHFSAKQY